MITWIVEPNQVDKSYSVRDLLRFSKKFGHKIIIRKFGIIENGEFTLIYN